MTAMIKQSEFSPEAISRLTKLYGSPRAKSIIESLKTPGTKYYLRVNTLRSTPEEVVSLLRGEGIEAFTFGKLNDVVYLPVKGPYKIAKLEKFVIAEKEAAEAVYMGANLYGPGVISAKGVLEGDYVNVTNPRGYVVAEGLAMMDGDEMVARKRGLAVKVTRSIYKVPSVRELDIYYKGLVYDQCLPAIVAGHVLNPKPGWLVVDMCAAPGGKATHAAQLMEGEGTVIAVDRSESKCRRIVENAQRLGLKNIVVRAADSRYLDLTMEDLKGSVDAIILDPPCSALGVRPTLYYERGENDFRALSAYQWQFLKVAARLLRRGGLLLYSTCTLTLEENELLVEKAVKELGLRLRRQNPFYGSRGFLNMDYMVQRFEPDLHDTPGFFIALLEKV